MRTLAYLREQLIQDEDYTTASICITRQDWEQLCFPCMQLDEEEDLPFSERDHPDGFNMILMHPKTKELFWAYSCDFDFKKQKRRVTTPAKNNLGFYEKTIFTRP